MDDRPYLTPAELDFRRDESVTALGDGRYVVATDAQSATGNPGRSPSESGSRASRRRTDHGASAVHPTDGPSAEEGVSPDGTTGERPNDEDDADESTPAYFADVTVRTDEGEFDARFEDDDIGAVCASLLRWYARRVAPDDDPEEVLSILLSRSAFDL